MRQNSPKPASNRANDMIRHADDLRSRAVDAWRAQQFPAAFELCCECVEANPANDYSKMLLAHFGTNVTITSFAPIIKRAMARCLQSPKVAHEKLQRRWRELFLLDPAMAPLKAIMDAPAAPIDTQSEWKRLQGPMSDPFLTEGLRMMVMTDPAFESLFRRLRAWLLMDAASQPGLLRNKHLPFLGALAENCFLNEYAFSFSMEEAEKSAALKTRVESTDDPDPVDVSLLACYQPLYRIANVKTLAQKQWPQEMRGLIKLQIAEPLEEEEIKPHIDVLVPVKGEVATKVRAMYEENPYPRWRAIDLQPALNQGISGDYLCAGCGTAHALSQNAHQFFDVSFQAVDLSLSSLAYATRKTREYGIQNLHFHQCDIMDIEALPGVFDVIESVGVLHHMADPGAGLKKLVTKLAPGGRMLLGFYSATGRRHIIAAQNYIKEKEIPPTPDGIRAAQLEILNLPPDHPFASMRALHDFYPLSECRDLLFHVQEKNYALPEITQMLSDSKLSFQGFRLGNPLLKQLYRERFPAEPTLLDLANWESLEKEFPDLFTGMYQFICCRAGEENMRNETVVKMDQKEFFGT